MNQQRMSPPHIPLSIDCDKQMNPDGLELDPSHPFHYRDLFSSNSHANARDESHPSPSLAQSPIPQNQTKPFYTGSMENTQHLYEELVPVSTNNPQNKHNEDHSERLYSEENIPQYAPLLSGGHKRPYPNADTFQSLDQSSLYDANEASLRQNFDYYPYGEDGVTRITMGSSHNIGLEHDAYLSSLRMSNHKSTLSTSSMVSLSRDPPSFASSSISLLRPIHGHTPQPLQCQPSDYHPIQTFPTLAYDTAEGTSQARSFRPSSMFLQLTPYSNSASPRKMSRRSSLNILSTFSGSTSSRYSVPHSPGTISSSISGHKVSKSLHVPKSKIHGHARLRSQIVSLRPTVPENRSHITQCLLDFQQVGALALAYAYPAPAADIPLSTVPQASSRSEDEAIPLSRSYLENPATIGVSGDYESASRAAYMNISDVSGYHDFTPTTNDPRFASEYNAIQQRHSFQINQERDPQLQFQYPQQLEFPPQSQYSNVSPIGKTTEPLEPTPSITNRGVPTNENIYNRSDTKLESFPSQSLAILESPAPGQFSYQISKLPRFSEYVERYTNTHDTRDLGQSSQPQYMEHASSHNQNSEASYYQEANPLPIASKPPSYPYLSGSRNALAMINLATVDTTSPPPISRRLSQSNFIPAYHSAYLPGNTPSSTTGAASPHDAPPQVNIQAYTLPRKAMGAPSYSTPQPAHQRSMLDITSFNNMQAEHLNIQNEAQNLETTQVGRPAIASSISSTIKSSKQVSTEIDAKKKHKCPICEARFQRPEHVKRHLKSHSLEKPYQCEEKDCDKRFNRKDNLKAHLKKIHGKHM